MLIRLTKKDCHTASTMGADTVAICKMQGFAPRLENNSQTREEANAFGYKAEFAVARLFGAELPEINILSDGGIDIWLDDVSVDVKFTNKERGTLIFDTLDKFRAQIAVLVGRTEKDDVMRINGWVAKNDFAMRSKPHDFGYGERLIMNADDLLPIENLWKRLAVKRMQPNNP